MPPLVAPAVPVLQSDPALLAIEDSSASSTSLPFLLAAVGLVFAAILVACLCWMRSKVSKGRSARVSTTKLKQILTAESAKPALERLVERQSRGEQLEPQEKQALKALKAVAEEQQAQLLADLREQLDLEREVGEMQRRRFDSERQAAEREIVEMREQVDELEQLCEYERSWLERQQFAANRAAEARIVDLESARWAENVKMARFAVQQATHAKSEWDAEADDRAVRLEALNAEVQQLAARLPSLKLRTARLTRKSKKARSSRLSRISRSNEGDAAPPVAPPLSSTDGEDAGIREGDGIPPAIPPDGEGSSTGAASGFLDRYTPVSEGKFLDRYKPERYQGTKGKSAKHLKKPTKPQFRDMVFL